MIPWAFEGLLPVAVLGAALVQSGGAALPAGSATFADGTSVRVEIADTHESMARGLMFRKSLDEHAGMLFVFDAPGFYPFWMQNCVIPLDIVWIGADHRVVSIAANAQPCRMPGCDPPCGSDACPTISPASDSLAKYVIEVRAGFAATHHVAVGQAIKITR